MKRFSAKLLATIALLITGSSAFGQVQQAGHCDSAENSGVNYVGYHAADWQNCDTCQKGQKPGRTGCIPPKAFPDSGWAPPVNYPVNYDGAWYGSYHPQAYYGSPGGGFIANYPTVYQPNDTTQLGYSYHKVPTWQSRPGMIPPTPFPGNFHSRGCIGGHCGHGFGTHGNYSGSCETCNGGYASHHHSGHGHQSAYMAPNGGRVVRPVAQKQSVFSKMRMASFTELFD